MGELNEPERGSLGYAWYVIAVLFLAYTFSFIDRQILALLVGPVKADLGLSDFQFSLLHGLAFGIFYTLMGIPLGRLADSSNRRNLIAAGVALWSLMTALCGFAKNFTQLFLARIGVGVGEAALSPGGLLADCGLFSQRKAWPCAGRLFERRIYRRRVSPTSWAVS